MFNESNESVRQPEANASESDSDGRPVDKTTTVDVAQSHS
jgi:hypothetical protein